MECCRLHLIFFLWLSHPRKSNRGCRLLVSYQFKSSYQNETECRKPNAGKKNKHCISALLIFSSKHHSWNPRQCWRLHLIFYFCDWSHPREIKRGCQLHVNYQFKSSYQNETECRKPNAGKKNKHCISALLIFSSKHHSWNPRQCWRLHLIFYFCDWSHPREIKRGCQLHVNYQFKSSYQMRLKIENQTPVRIINISFQKITPTN